jgi:NADPH:quinone reductase-like Zn-dependent oxidoreductase
MKAFEIEAFGIDNLKLVDREEPSPGPGEVLVRLKAASLNFRDLMVAEGTYNPRLKLPMVPLSDGVGIVEQIGSGVTRVKTGDRVAGIFMQRWIDGAPNREKAGSALGGAIDGVLREYMIFQQDGLVAVPDYLTDVEAATLPCTGVTAWHALFEEKPAKPGETVVIIGTGGVAIFALQFAAFAGLRSIVLSSNNEKLERTRQMGATHTVNYRENPDWDKTVRSLTEEGADQIIELGGADTLPRSLKAIRMGGSISVIGALGGGDPNISPVPILMQTVRLQGIYVGSRTMFENMNRALGLLQLRPVVDRVFPWQKVQDAMRYMQEQKHFGKICLQF